MREVTRKIKEAFYAEESKKVSNTETDGTSVWLFGNEIIKREDDKIFVTLAGWPSRTTMERLRGIIGPHFYIMKEIPFMDGHRMDPYKWYDVTYLTKDGYTINHD